MPHIHLLPGQHDLTISAYIVSKNQNTGHLQVLFHEHKKVGKLMVPGGHVELNENPWEGLVHEILEETGYEINQLHVLQPQGLPTINLNDDHTVQHPIPFVMDTHVMETNVKNHNHINLSYLFYTDETPQHEVTGDESTIFAQLSTNQLKNMSDNEILMSMQKAALAALKIVEQKLWV